MKIIMFFCIYQNYFYWDSEKILLLNKHYSQWPTSFSLILVCREFAKLALYITYQQTSMQLHLIKIFLSHFAVFFLCTWFQILLWWLKDQHYACCCQLSWVSLAIYFIFLCNATAPKLCGYVRFSFPLEGNYASNSQRKSWKHKAYILKK